MRTRPYSMYLFSCCPPCSSSFCLTSLMSPQMPGSHDTGIDPNAVLPERRRSVHKKQQAIPLSAANTVQGLRDGTGWERRHGANGSDRRRGVHQGTVKRIPLRTKRSSTTLSPNRETVQYETVNWLFSTRNGCPNAATGAICHNRRGRPICWTWWC